MEKNDDESFIVDFKEDLTKSEPKASEIDKKYNKEPRVSQD